MTTTTYLDRMLEPVTEPFTTDLAQRLVDLRADEELAGHIEDLRAKARSGTLSAAEDAEYKSFVEAVDLISILQLKARRFLQQHAH